MTDEARERERQAEHARKFRAVALTMHERVTAMLEANPDFSREDVALIFLGCAIGLLVRFGGPERAVATLAAAARDLESGAPLQPPN